ncbi:mycothiol transferase [Terrabacter terrigena]|uniref:DUF664 domain-containing protein n=1 Tax=Terrabacter terrigena TaxID=574718 RepID=A0ABW3MZ08_9MICO
MTTTRTDPPWEPPLDGSEQEHLLGALERLRASFRFKADGLDGAGLRHQIPSSSLTIGGLLKHLALIEDFYSTHKLHGEPLGDAWDGSGVGSSDEWEFESAADDAPEQLYELYDGAVERSRQRVGAVLAAGGLGQPVHAATPDGRHASLRRLLLDLVEEYGRHAGHADILREAVDGVVGEDPPDGWSPASGRFTFA